MWYDETPRLFSVANMLQKKKNKEDNYEFDDFPDVKTQALTGKYDNNFDALGSDFERAHSYNLNNIQQPEFTKSDVDFSDNKYNHFLRYEPSTYVRLEEDEYKPFTKSDEKANEYYIDKLQGKTLDDLVISKMKENAGAADLPRDAARRQFAEGLILNESRNASNVIVDVSNDQSLLRDDSVPAKPVAPKKNRTRGETTLANIVISEPIVSTTSGGGGGGGGGNSRREKPLSTENLLQEPSTVLKVVDKKSSNIIKKTVNEPVEKVIKKLVSKPVTQQSTTTAQTPLEGNKNQSGLIKKQVSVPEEVKVKKLIKEEPEEPEEEVDLETKLQQIRAEIEIAKATERGRRDELKELVPIFEKHSDERLDDDSWIRYQALSKYYKFRPSRNTKYSKAAANLQSVLDNFAKQEKRIKDDNKNDERLNALKARFALLNSSPLRIKQPTTPSVSRTAKTHTGGSSSPLAEVVGMMSGL